MPRIANAVARANSASRCQRPPSGSDNVPLSRARITRPRTTRLFQPLWPAEPGWARTSSPPTWPLISLAQSGRLRQTTQPRPRVIQNGTPKDALAATQSILKMPSNRSTTQHQAALQACRERSGGYEAGAGCDSDTEERSTIHAEATALNNLRDRAGKVQTLDDMNDFGSTWTRSRPHHLSPERHRRGA